MLAVKNSGREKQKKKRNFVQVLQMNGSKQWVQIQIANKIYEIINSMDLKSLEFTVLFSYC